ncbi:A/G-specific adenine glycosylase [Desulfopila aestuarii]|uniref:Adenine DNA glycosylase n=1 Tax=Desulfopila aestuarii DSM 18488 TaxID=1121416 RepID=A0A1M7YC89_9BACT|nr:A/G-specific adenine glycosylase [Desulfopila aestuarii]SHO50254.1 A/G-specific DNA-adenine glycosylase [Desulfopila aestuarii DSM 18488]
MNDFVFENKQQVQQRLLDWFIRTDRQLPWRKTYDPYHVWISEIMLQQTQMERGIDYFNRWLLRFPDVHAVAAADEHEILKNWEGLGYYARARNLHAAAKIISWEYSGIIPCDPGELQGLPGIGPYTAAAVSSIACNTDIPVVDANVLRVYARIFDIDGQVKSGATRKKIEQLAREMLPKGRARQFNQALMDFGGLVCLPRNPDCSKCPIAFGCLAWQRGTVADRPVTTSTKKTILIEMATGVLESGGKLFIQQRKNEDIWGGLWEFPGGRLEEGEEPAETVVREYREETGFPVKVCNDITSVIHFYTRYKVVLHCYAVTLAGSEIQPRPQLTAAQDYRWVEAEELVGYAFPAGHRKLMEYIADYCPELLLEPCAGR